MGDGKCRSCGEASVEEDDGQIVCTACGHVQEDATSYQLDRGLEEYSQACHSGSAFRPTFASDNYRMRSANPSTNTWMQKYIQCIHVICEQLQIRNKEMHKEATSVFKDAMKHDHFRKLRTAKKTAVCVSCVYVMCRRHNLPMLISDLTSFTDQPCASLAGLSRKLMKDLGIQIDTPSIEEYVPTCLATFGVKDKQLIDKTTNIASLATDAWLTCGRRAAPVVIAACCIAWLTSTPSNHKKSKAEFRRAVLNQKPPYFMTQRCSELCKILKEMATRVPWISKSVLAKQNSWMYYLDDILRYRKSLLHSLEMPEDDPTPEEDADVILIKEQKETFLVAPPCFKENVRKRQLEGDDDNDEARKIAKSGHMTAESMNNPELSEKDIPDSELGLYIKTPQEVEITRVLSAITNATSEKVE
ncbi:transcription factor IIIB 50 kDa subunit-like [Diadema setosum]|uniref:transcription factor IIIB 50 kDa subunit-like n=1 Tax=Diadema setosum TaxID=31175 RepID=UPI003B3B4102